MSDKFDLCVPCAAALFEQGRRMRKVREVPNVKLTCSRCGRRRYGATYQTDGETALEGKKA